MSTDTLALRLFSRLLPALALAACVGDGKDTGHSGVDSGLDTGETAANVVDGLGCMGVADGTTECPASGEVSPGDLMGGCGSETVAVTGEGTVHVGNPLVNSPDKGLYCCYPIQETEPECDYGRPYLESGVSRVAPPIEQAGGWVGALAPELGGLSDAERAVLAARWTASAQDEHAAVAAFCRVALELLAAGAPADLVDDTCQAARDEVEHARMGFGLASAYAGHTVAPGRFPFRAPVLPTGDLVALAVAAAREGCVGETVSTLLAMASAERAGDAAAHRVLARIAEDEVRHAQLAWRTVRWAVVAGGAPVRAAVEEVFAAVARQGVAVPLREGLGGSERLAHHGLLDHEESRAVAHRAVVRVILPMAHRLLEGGAPSVAPVEDVASAPS